MLQDGLKAIHNEEIENVQIWSIIIKYLPILKQEAERLILK